MNKKGKISIVVILIILLVIIGIILAVYFIRRRNNEKKPAMVNIFGKDDELDPITRGGSNVLYYDETIKRGPYSLTLNKDGLVYNDGKDIRKILSSNEIILNVNSFVILESVGNLALYFDKDNYDARNTISSTANECESGKQPDTTQYIVFLTINGLLIQGVKDNKPFNVCSL
jgi:uncharacterized protein YxeA